MKRPSDLQPGATKTPNQCHGSIYDLEFGRKAFAEVSPTPAVCGAPIENLAKYQLSGGQLSVSFPSIKKSKQKVQNVWQER